MRRIAALTFLLGLLLSFSASAATVDGEGISINGGHGYMKLAGPTQANAGDSVMASPGGHGTIVYSDGCVVHVYPGAVVTVQEGSCKVAKPMTLAETNCDPKELNCPPPAPVAGAFHPIWPLFAAGLFVATPIIIGTSLEHEEKRIVTTVTVPASVPPE
jgi:hypothetical protein